MNFQVKLAQLYIMLVPFITAFSLTPWLPLPLLYMMPVSIYLIVVRRLKIFKEDLEIILMVILGILGMFFALDKLGIKNLNHICAILTSIFFFYIVFKSLINRFKSINVLASSLAFSLAFVSIFIIIEFIVSNYLGITISDFVPYGNTNKLTDATLMGSIIRPRGLAIEAGHMATFYELALPLSFIYLKDKPLSILISYYSLVLSGYILLFSAASFVALPLAILVSAVIRIRSKSSIALVIGIVMITFIALSSDIARPYINETVGVRLEIFLDPSQRENSVADDRSDIYQTISNLFLVAPFGIGWGTASQMAVDNEAFAGIMMPEGGGFISLYGEILIASGLLGLLLFLRFITKKIIQLLRLSSLESQLVLIAVLSLSIHYIFISNYWFPMLWLSLVLADHVYKNEKFIA
ncbi:MULTISPECIES: O-antigen ligase family protein [unclassified Nostoc]|uniref:O-antigen ligase family protein n=1 Tax=unclassified Nostoc TaxID=2593658 RepID=UPI0026173B55|nr:O-antigen ligase family protein [Nostoc sp. S13]MDF5737004.1 O-antigen ligase family protein [Nostoc sp. S13]